MFAHILASAVLVAEVGEAGDVTQADALTHAREHELHFTVPQVTWRRHNGRYEHRLHRLGGRRVGAVSGLRARFGPQWGPLAVVAEFFRARADIPCLHARTESRLHFRVVV